MENVLIITYVFPPTGGAGVQRPIKFVKYLKNFGWNPIVLTPRNPSVPLHDSSMLNDIPEGIGIIRTRTWEPPYKWKDSIMADDKGKSKPNNSIFSVISRSIKRSLKSILKILLQPDPQIGWLPSAIFYGIKAIRNKEIRLIFVTAPPFSSLLVGVLLKVFSRKPWIADFRDEWVGFYSKGFEKGRAGYINRWLERLVIRSAERVICATEGYVNVFKAKYPRIPEDKFVVITNGYDSSDFLPFKDKGKNHSHYFTITYAGTVFPITTLRYFLKALKTLPKSYKDNIKVNIVGRVTPAEEIYFDNGVNYMINKTGYVEHTKCIGYMIGSTLLLLTLDNLEGSERIIPAKFFEYMAAQKPILALVPEGEVSKIVKRIKSGYVVHPKDIEGIKTTLMTIYEKRNELNFEVKDEIKLYSRESLTKKLAKVFDEVLEKNNDI